MNIPYSLFTATLTKKTFPLSLLLAIYSVGTPAMAQTTTDPAQFTVVEEQSPSGGSRSLDQMFNEVDNRSLISIKFTEAKMALPGATEACQAQGKQAAPPCVRIRVDAFIVKGVTSTPIVPIDNYVSSSDAASGTHDKVFNPAIGASVVPDTTISLRALDTSDIDHIDVKVTNLITQESLSRILVPQPFGFRGKVSDSLLFLKRLSVSEQDRTAGLDEFNFGPAPGVTYGGTYQARQGFGRFLQPGIGMNVSFMNWKDPAFDIGTGQFNPGTTASSVNVGMGALFSLFDNSLQVTYGWNLHAEQKRTYFGVGVSFINLSTKITELIKK